MLFNKEFDLIVSLGEDCACTSYLRRFNLQKYSYPFDWLSNASFQTRIDLVCNDFKDFLNIEDIITYPKINSDTENNKKYDLYQNTKTGFHYYHDFIANIPFEESYYSVKEKYTRRINRLYSQIKCANNILFVWWSKDKILDKKQIEKAYLSLKEKFNTKDICLLCIENFPINENIELFDGNLLIAHYDNASYRHNPKWNETMGNELNNTKIFKQICLNTSLADKFWNILYKNLKFLISFIPIRNLRHMCRDKLNFYKNHAKL